MKHGLDVSGYITETGDYAGAILKVIDTLPFPSIVLIILVLTMIAFYSTTFDALTMVVSSYSYKRLKIDAEPDKRVRVFWSVLFILFPIALLFAENTLYSLQSVTIIAAFPIGIISILIILSFFKDAKKYLAEKESEKSSSALKEATLEE